MAAGTAESFAKDHHASAHAVTRTSLSFPPRPTILSPRANTLGQFCVGLMLDEGAAPSSSGDNVADQMQHFLPRPTRHSYFSGRVRCNGSDR